MSTPTDQQRPPEDPSAEPRIPLGDSLLDAGSLASVFEQAPAYICIVQGPEHVFVLANALYRGLVGHRPLVGHPAREALPELAGQGHFELLDEVRRTGRPYVGRDVEVYYQNEMDAPPESHYVNFVYQPIMGASGVVNGILVHGVDVTDQVRARELVQENAAELEATTEELQAQAAALEEVQMELEASNEDLHRINVELEKRSAEAVRERAAAELLSARLEAVLRQMPSGVLLAEAPSGRFILGNAQVDAILQATPGDPPLTDLAAVTGLHPDGRPYGREEWPLYRSLAGETVINEEIVIVREDGTRRIAAVSSAPIRGATEEVVAVVAIFENITERREHEDEQSFLHEAGRVLTSSLDYRETLRSIARLAVPRMADWCGVEMLVDGRIERLAMTHSDPSKEEMALELERRWPMDPDAPAGVPNVLRTGVSELFPFIPDEFLVASAQSEEHLEVLRQVGLRSGMVVPMVSRGRVLGTISFVAAESGRLYDADDLATAEQLASRAAVAVENARLFSEANAAREEAERARATAEIARGAAEAGTRAKGEFLANMSHELRTPLNAIAGYAELLQMGIGGSLAPAHLGYVQRIRSSGEHLRTLVDDILDLAKIEAGGIRVERAQVPLRHTVHQALDVIAPAALQAEVEIVSEIGSSEPVTYWGDADRTRQILVNLMSNAVKFTEPGGRIRVHTETRDPGPDVRVSGAGPWLAVSVEDTGIGIPPEHLGKIFEPFHQVETGYTRESGGTGLGLSISRQLARMMGGDLTVSSELGEGSCFTLWLIAASEATVDREGEPWESPIHSLPILREAGHALAQHAQAILERLTLRLREDPATPGARSLDQAHLEDHMATFLVDIGLALIALEEGGDPSLMGDGTEIQRLISDRHGAQRARLGWTEAAVRREFELLREVVADILRLHLERSPDDSAADAIAVVMEFLGRAERISLRGWSHTFSHLEG